MRVIVIITALLSFGLNAIGQTNIQIVIKDSGKYKIDRLDAYDVSQKEIYSYGYKDTLFLKFDKTNIDCYNIEYHGNGKIFRQQVWLDTGKVKIEAHFNSDKLIIDTVFNSPIYYAVKDFNKKNSELRQTRDTSITNAFLLKAYEKNIDNPFSFWVGASFLNFNKNSQVNLLKLKKLTNRQGDRLSWFLGYSSVVDRLNTMLTVDKIDLNGFSFIDKQDNRTKPILDEADYYIIDFWFLACAPCIQDHKAIKVKQDQLKQLKIQLISISIDKNHSGWLEYLTTNNYYWQNYLEDPEDKITEKLNITGYPTYIILNNKGEIIETYNSFADITRKFKLGN